MSMLIKRERLAPEQADNLLHLDEIHADASETAGNQTDSDQDPTLTPVIGNKNANKSNHRHVCIELGRARLDSIPGHDLRTGTAITLDQGIDDPLQIFADKTLVARGEIVIIENRFCVRVTEVWAHVNALA
jgi:flagellar motor switch/type III secretory pathway protein FliN